MTAEKLNPEQPRHEAGQPFAPGIVQFFAALSVFGLASCAAMAQVNGEVSAANVLSGCRKISPGSQFMPADLDVGICLGATMTTASSLSRLHTWYYGAYFPNITFPVPSNLVQAYMAAYFALGPDVCFPSKVTAGELALAVARYGAAHPNKVSGPGYAFIVDALDWVYTCAPVRH